MGHESGSKAGWRRDGELTERVWSALGTMPVVLGSDPGPNARAVFSGREGKGWVSQ